MEPEALNLDDMICVASASHFMLEYQERNKLSKITWIRVPNSLEYQHTIMTWFQHLKTKQVELTLFNNEQAGLISDEDKVWSEYYITHMLPNTNLRKLASVVSHNIFQRMLIRNMHVKDKSQQYEHRFFTDDATAYSWLVSTL